MQSSSARLVALLSLAAIWLLTHRYFGIHHDGLFYAVQALARTDPAAFRHDLFFEFGSQDDYSLFSRAYALLIGILGLGQATFVLLVAAHLAWALAAWALARQWLQGSARWIGLAMVFALPRQYGAQGDYPQDILSYAENFLTARSWAEPLVLAAVAACIGGHRRIALVAIAASFLCHPIIALPGLIFLFFFVLQPGARMTLFLALAAALVAIGLPTMDAPWLELVRRRAPFVLLDTWAWGELGEALAWISILLAAAAGAAAATRRGYLALALTGIAGLYLSLLGTATGAALLIQAQGWRCLWLLKVAALLALAAMFAGRWRRSAADRWLLAGLAASAMTAQTLGGPVALLLAGLGYFAWKKDIPPDLPRWLPLAGGLALAVVLFESFLALLQQLTHLAQRLAEWVDPAGAMPKGDPAAYLQGPLALLLPLGLAMLLVACRRHPRISVLAAALTLVVSATGWYRAGDAWQTALFAESPQRPFGELIARHETVYWQDNFQYTWFLLRQGNYASMDQSVGVVFSQATARESIRRLDRLAAFGSRDTDGPGGRKQGQGATRAGLAALCQDPVLDVVILARRVDDLDAPQWADPLAATPWHLYRCAAFRQAS